MPKPIIREQGKSSRTFSLSWAVILIYVLTTALLTSLRLGSLVNLVFPMGALGCRTNALYYQPTHVHWICLVALFFDPFRETIG